MSGISVAQVRALLNDGYTCVLYRQDETLKSKARGVAPLVEWLQSGKNFYGFSAMDKVVGKAAAFLYVLLKVEKVHAVVLSDGAEGIFRRFKMAYSYEEKVPMIRNRTNTGFCPMEQAVLDVQDLQTAYARIYETLERLKEQNQ